VNQTPAPAEPTEDSPPPLPVLREPADGVPDVVATPTALEQAAAAIAAGSGPVAIDAERASGHRYGQRAFLVQLRRTGSGTSLVDPAALSDLQPLARALSGTEWILHASTQDLPCLAELGLRPDALFDTEHAARLLGMPRVGLAGLTEDLLGVGLAKGHGAADWSQRPLPAEWLTYAALDVELLIPMRELLWQRPSSSSTGSAPRSARPAPRASTPRPAPTTSSSTCIRELLRRNPNLPKERSRRSPIAATTQIGDQGLTLGRSGGPALRASPAPPRLLASTACAPVR
jgi:ribonuclease D